MQTVRSLPPPGSIIANYPTLPIHQVDDRRVEVESVLAGQDPRLLMIVGPCSAWPFEAVKEYAERLAEVQAQVRQQILIVLRSYIQKPRTKVGWPGSLTMPDPRPKARVNIVEGISRCREMMWECAKHLPLADEMLFTHNDDYFIDLISYLALGARSAEDMEHRYVASGQDVAVGVKNPTSGDISVGVNGVVAVQHPHEFAHHGKHVRSSGNPYAHLILRGGSHGANYGAASIDQATAQLLQQQVANPAIIIDASHDNARNGDGEKHATHQIQVVEDVVRGIVGDPRRYSLVRGVMVESFLEAGKREVSQDMDMSLGQSITDACIGFEDTRVAILNAADLLDARRS